VLKRSDKLVTLPVSGTALLLIDVINDLAFDGSQGLVAQAEPSRGSSHHLHQRQLRPVAI